MSARQRLVLVFLRSGDELLLVQRAHGAATYPGRWTTVSGFIGAGESAAQAARRALTEELPGADALELVLERGGLHVDFSDTVKKKSVSFRVYPFLARVPAAAPRPLPPLGRWVTPDLVIAAGSVGETVPELDEALARVWDPAAALPPQFRAEARALAGARGASRELALRAAALVAGGAPPERVAALRPELARFVNAARAATSAERDVAGDLLLAGRAEARAVASAVDAAGRAGAVGPVPSVPGRELLAGDAARLDVLLLAAEAVLPRGEVVAHAGALAAIQAQDPRVPVLACADAWAVWDDELAPSLPDELELVPRDLVTRVIGLPN